MKLSWLSFFYYLGLRNIKKNSWFDSSFGKYFWLFIHRTIRLKSGFCFRYCIGDLITPYYWSCSVLIILTNQSLLLFDSKYCGSFDLLIWVDYMSEVARKRNNKTTFIIKNTALRLKYIILLVEIMTRYANYKAHTKFNWTQSVMWSYQILYAIA